MGVRSLQEKLPEPRNDTSGASLAFGADVLVSFGGSLTANR